MKSIAIAALLSAFATSTALAQPVSPSGPGNVCIRTDYIDRTKTPDDRTILFYMKDHKVYVTHLATMCPELRFNGFIYMPTPPEQICGNLQTIRVIRTGSVCMMGPIVPFNPPPPPAQPS